MKVHKQLKRYKPFQVRDTCIQTTFSRQPLTQQTWRYTTSKPRKPVWNHIWKENSSTYLNNVFEQSLKWETFLKMLLQNYNHNHRRLEQHRKNYNPTSVVDMKPRYIIAYSDTSHISHSKCQRNSYRSGCNILLEKTGAEFNYMRR